MNMLFAPRLFCSVVSVALLAGCERADKTPGDPATIGHHQHEHHAPHGGTAVALGDEAFHLELVLDAASGELRAFVLDGEMENFVRCAMPSFEMNATSGGQTHRLIFAPVADEATGETVGDTSLFAATAEWLKHMREFDASIPLLTIRGATFRDVAVRFPDGHEH